MRKLSFLPTLLVLIMLASCRDEGVSVTTITGEVPTPAIITATITAAKPRPASAPSERQRSGHGKPG